MHPIDFPAEVEPIAVRFMNSDRTTEKAKLQAKKQRLTQAIATLSLS